VQYFLSRAHRLGALTLEGRALLPELFAWLRNLGP
jgi:hypothetical protein